MGTKNLARTAIEGGRTGSNKWERRDSHNSERASARDYCNKVRLDPESYEDFDIEEKDHVRKEFNDKLGPMYRWLASQCGRPWDEVRSEVSKTFDTRTTAGRHIVNDHLLSSVEEVPDYRYGRYYRGPEDSTTSYYRHDFYVDDAGILKEKTVIKRRNYERPPAFNTQQIANWLSGRVVGQVGSKFFWFVPSDKNKKRGGENRTWITQWGGSRGYYSNRYGLHFYYLHRSPIYKYDEERHIVYEDGKPIILDYKETWQDSTPTFRQDRKLNDKEMAFWNTIPEYYQTKVLERSPTYPDPPKPDYYGYY